MSPPTDLAAQIAAIRERVALPPAADSEWRWAATSLLWAYDELAQKDERTLLLQHVVSRATSLIYASPEMRALAEERLAEALTEFRAFERADGP